MSFVYIVKKKLILSPEKYNIEGFWHENELQIIFYLNVCDILMILMPKRLTVKGFE